MNTRTHLFSLKIGYGLQQALAEGYNSKTAVKDLFAGVSIGIIAVPLSMALAIASGVAPQHGLYTAIIAGIVIALTGGSRYSISGPTAAFVVILAPIASTFGLAGLLTATWLAGIILIAMALTRLGRFIEYIPNSVTLGFTVGIAVVIFTLQIPDFLGITIDNKAHHYWEKIIWIVLHTPETSMPNLAIACLTIAIMLLWPKLIKHIPPHLPAIVFATVAGIILNTKGMSIDTIATRFHYLTPEGISLGGIPPYLPAFDWPWAHTALGENKLALNLETFRKLLPASFAIAMLGAIESLLCAVILDGISGKRHSANSELLGQGLGNLLVPFFGGFSATAAIARSSANYKAGAFSPLASVVHAFIVLSSLIFLPELLGMIPMAAMAALLMIVAWNMSELHKAKKLLKTAPLSDSSIFITCMSLTILFDMVIAISVGVVLSSLLFMKNMAEMTKIHDITANKRFMDADIKDGTKIFKINGPLFFAAADRIFDELTQLSTKLNRVVLYLDGVSVLDEGGLNAFMRFVNYCETKNIQLYLADFQMQPLRTLAKSGFKETETTLTFSTLEQAIELLKSESQNPN